MMYTPNNSTIDAKEFNNQNSQQFFHLKILQENSKLELYWHKMHFHFINCLPNGQFIIMKIKHQNYKISWIILEIT